MLMRRIRPGSFIEVRWLLTQPSRWVKTAWRPSLGRSHQEIGSLRPDGIVQPCPQQPCVRHVTPARCVRGRVVLPGDKSISHRYALLGAMADGLTRIERLRTRAGLRRRRSPASAQLGVTVERPSPGTVVIHGRGIGGLRSSDRRPRRRQLGLDAPDALGHRGGPPLHHSHSPVTRRLRRRPMRRIVDSARADGRPDRARQRPPPLDHSRHRRPCRASISSPRWRAPR